MRGGGERSQRIVGGHIEFGGDGQRLQFWCGRGIRTIHHTRIGLTQRNFDDDLFYIVFIGHHISKRAR